MVNTSTDELWSRGLCVLFFIADWFKRNRVEDWRDRKGP